MNDKTPKMFTCEDFFFSDWKLEGLEDIEDERLDVETVFSSVLGVTLSVTSALLSTFASLLIMYIILRSAKSLMDPSSVYHRILFGMSMFDILQSLAIAFVTLPMPTDMIYRQFQGIVIGNHLTCQIQGFFVAWGGMTGILYNLILSIYYLCSIRFDMSDDVFSKRLEPWLHTISMFLGTLIAVLIIFADGFNPNPTQSNWCGSNTYPYYCTSYAEKEKHALGLFVSRMIGSISFVALIIYISCMVLIAKKVRRQEKETADEDDQNENAPATSVHSRMREERLNDIKIITKQAWAYTIVNLFNYTMFIVLPLIRNMLDNPILPTWCQAMVLILRPIQGLLNCIIFIYHKVHSLQRNDPTLGFAPALKMVLRGQEGRVRIVSDLTLVRHHSALLSVQFARDMNANDDDDEENDNDDQDTSDPSRFALSGIFPFSVEAPSPALSSPKITNANPNSSANENRQNEEAEQELIQSSISESPDSASRDIDLCSQDLSGFQSSSQVASSHCLSYSQGSFHD